MANIHKSFRSRAGWYHLTYPAHWEAVDDQDCLTLYDSKGNAGALQISAYRSSLREDVEDVLLTYCSDNRIDVLDHRLRLYECNGQHVASYTDVTEEWHKGYWFICKGSCLLFVTYTCKADHWQREQAIVDELVQSIEITDDGVDGNSST